MIIIYKVSYKYNDQMQRTFPGVYLSKNVPQGFRLSDTSKERFAQTGLSQNCNKKGK